MNALNPNSFTNSPAFPFEFDNTIYVRKTGNNSPVFVKVHVADILFLERKHDCPITSIHLIGGGSVETDASIDEIISASPSPVLFKTLWDEAVNIMHIDIIEGNSFIIGGRRHYHRDDTGVELRSHLILCKADRRYSSESDNNGKSVSSTDYTSVLQNGINSRDIYFFSGVSHIRVRLDNIIWIRAAGNYCDIHLVNSSNPLCVIFLIGRLAAHLPRHLFVRISRSIIVNLNFVERIQGPVLFVPGCQLKVPCHKVRDIPSWFNILKQH